MEIQNGDSGWRFKMEIQNGDSRWRFRMEIQDGDSRCIEIQDAQRFNFSKILAMTIENFSLIISDSLQPLAAWGAAKLQWET